MQQEDIETIDRKTIKQATVEETSKMVVGFVPRKETYSQNTGMAVITQNEKHLELEFSMYPIGESTTKV